MTDAHPDPAIAAKVATWYRPAVPDDLPGGFCCKCNGLDRGMLRSIRYGLISCCRACAEDEAKAALYDDLHLKFRGLEQQLFEARQALFRLGRAP